MNKGRFEKGHIPWNKCENPEYSEETRLKMRLAKLGKPNKSKGKPRPHCSGKNHWNYKGNSSESYMQRRNFRTVLQKDVFKRDNYKCVLCLKAGDLQVDHIKSWAKYPELRFDINNCRTLCVECHYEVTFNRKMPKTSKTWGHNLKHRQAAVII